jgi:oxalate decarboxylase/phosphoglucose isomerase-like protein (cupin superfamily)
MEVRERIGNKFPYDDYIASEGLPIHHAVVGVADVTQLPRQPWARTGALATFVQLTGTFQSERGIYIAEIPGGQALEPVKHIYEEEIFVLAGRGVSQVWQGDGEKLTFEWGEGSVFAIPRNVTYRLFNAGSDPVIFMGVTTAPQVINALDDLDVVFNSDFQFTDIYRDDDKYFVASDMRTTEGWYQENIWHTNFIPDARRTALEALEQKITGGLLTGYRMGKTFPHGHISQWPSGRYHKAHYHGPGAILLGLEGEGYVLAWDSKLGPHPYQDGHGDEVHKVNWGRNSIYSPPNAYFHQHFNTGAGPAKHIAVYGAQLPLGVHGMVDEKMNWKGFLSVQEGGTLIEHRDEDPQIRRDFDATLREKGIESKMSDNLYATAAAR